MGRGIFSKDLGIDLGTANTLVFSRNKGVIIREPSVVAVNYGGKREILAVGEQAKSMIGRTPGSIVAVRPLRQGVIADFEMTEAMLRYFIEKAVQGSFFGRHPRVVICVPCGVTSVEKRAVEEAARSAGSREAYLLEEPIAAAIGAGLDIQQPMGSMVVDIGGGTSEVAVLSLGAAVTAKSLRVGGNHMDEAVIEYIKKEYNMMIGERTAEDIKINIGCAAPEGRSGSMEVRGRDVLSGLPNTITVSVDEIHDALKESCAMIVNAIRQTLEHTPPELSADIAVRGIVLTGGGALLDGIDRLISKETGMPVFIADNPLDCVVMGTGMALNEIETIKRLQAVPRHA